MIIILQHGPGEPAGAILPYLTGLGIPFKIVPLYESNEVPAMNIPSLVIILGGLMSVNDEKEFPFLKQEKGLIRDLAGKNIPVLGICLGAQMIANAFGARVYHTDEPEKGWCRIGKMNEGFFGHPDQYHAFQWHNETFDLPSGAHLLATGNPIRNQGFRLGSCIGVQYHVEVIPATIQNWIRDEPDYVRKSILDGTDRYMNESIELCGTLLNHFVRTGGEAWLQKRS